MAASGGSEDDSNRSVRSGEGKTQICGLNDDGSTGTIFFRNSTSGRGTSRPVVPKNV